jgi:hypothetical protein
MTLRTFSTAKELFDFLAERADRGDAALKVWQRDLARGAFAFTLVVHQAREPWPIFWEVQSGPTRDDNPDGARVAGHIPVASYHRMVKTWSALDPRGRVQQVHVGDAWGVLDMATFEACRDLGWKLTPALRERLDFAFQRHAEMHR